MVSLYYRVLYYSTNRRVLPSSQCAPAEHVKIAPFSPAGDYNLLQPGCPLSPILEEFSFHKPSVIKYLAKAWERCNGFNGRHNPLLSQLFWADFARLPYQ